MTGTSPPGPLGCGSTTCRVNAVAAAASNALPPFSKVAMPTAVAIQWVEATTPKVPSISGRVVNGFGLMFFIFYGPLPSAGETPLPTTLPWTDHSLCMNWTVHCFFALLLAMTRPRTGGTASFVQWAAAAGAEAAHKSVTNERRVAHGVSASWLRINLRGEQHRSFPVE